METTSSSSKHDLTAIVSSIIGLKCTAVRVVMVNALCLYIGNVRYIESHVTGKRGNYILRAPIGEWMISNVDIPYYLYQGQQCLVAFDVESAGESVNKVKEIIEGLIVQAVSILDDFSLVIYFPDDLKLLISFDASDAKFRSEEAEGDAYEISKDKYFTISVEQNTWYYTSN